MSTQVNPSKHPIGAPRGLLTNRRPGAQARRLGACHMEQLQSMIIGESWHQDTLDHFLRRDDLSKLERIVLQIYRQGRDTNLAARCALQDFYNRMDDIEKSRDEA